LYIVEWNHTISIYIDFFDNINSDDCIMNNTLELIAKNIGLSIKHKKERYKFIDKIITFYGKYQTEPSYELFDKNKFDEAVEYVKEEIIRLTEQLKKEKENIINAIK